MKELKQLIIDQLCTEYSLKEAVDSLENAEIRIKGTTVTVIYDNGKSDKYELILIEKLKHIK